MNCISYSLFGYNEQHDQSLNFKSYLRGLHLNIRVAEVLYPGWDVSLCIDQKTNVGQYHEYFWNLEEYSKVSLKTIPQAPMCQMMLWRLVPIFEMTVKESRYDRVLCRDTDSLLSYRERQAVAYWEQGPKMAHSMTDSISHTIPLMGGMCAFRSGPFRERMGIKSFDELMALSQGIDYNHKGADQDFLNRYVLPKVHDSITEHFVLGHPQTFRGDCHNFIHDIDLGLPDEFKELNGYGFHIGASGMQTDAVVNWLKKWGKDNEYWDELEKQYKDVFYWKL